MHTICLCARNCKPFAIPSSRARLVLNHWIIFMSLVILWQHFHFGYHCFMHVHHAYIYVSTQRKSNADETALHRLHKQGMPAH